MFMKTIQKNVFFYEKGQRSMYHCTPHQVKKKNYNLKMKRDDLESMPSRHELQKHNEKGSEAGYLVSLYCVRLVILWSIMMIWLVNLYLY